MRLLKQDSFGARFLNVPLHDAMNILDQVAAGTLSATQAQEALGCSRHRYRVLLKAMRLGGAAAVAEQLSSDGTAERALMVVITIVFPRKRPELRETVFRAVAYMAQVAPTEGTRAAFERAILGPEKWAARAVFQSIPTNLHQVASLLGVDPPADIHHRNEFSVAIQAAVAEHLAADALAAQSSRNALLLLRITEFVESIDLGQ